MRKKAILNRPDENPMEAQDLLQMSGVSAQSDLRETIAQEIGTRSHRLSKLSVLPYQPCKHSLAQQLLQGWHLLFFARAGEGEMQELRRSLQEESMQDEPLMKLVRSIQVQYRQYKAEITGSEAESLASQAVIAELSYGRLSLTPGFWLPAEMRMGLSLLPCSGARLGPEGLQLLEHCKTETDAHLDVLMVTAAAPYTKAERVAQQSDLGDGLDLAKHSITFSTPLIEFAVEATPVLVAGANLFTATLGAVLATAAAIGYVPAKPEEEEMRIRGHNERVGSLGESPSVSQLLEKRQQLLTGKMHKRF